jgi:hypothetical protein
MKHELSERTGLSEQEEAAFAELTAALDGETLLLSEMKSELAGKDKANEASLLERYNRVEEAQKRTREALNTWDQVLRKSVNE